MAAQYGRGVVAAFPYRLRTVLTDTGVAFTNCAATRWDRCVHVFDRVCAEHGIEHRRTRAYRPWTNGHAERTVRTVARSTTRPLSEDIDPAVQLAAREWDWVVSH